VKVDFFTQRLSPAANHGLDAFGSLLFGLMGAALCWRGAAGMLTVQESGETSVILGWPVWIAQALMLPGLALMALAGFYQAGVHLRLARASNTTVELQS
jgi:TRAP-type C4-dicarboxylate transport system permease small subunit